MGNILDILMFFEQAIRLVSQSPDNLAYHILTLLAVQAALSIALWQWRQNRQDLFAGRLAGAAATIFLLRIILAAILATTNQSDLRLLLPPLERAMDMTITAVIVWALVPSLPSSPRLNEVALFLGLIAIIITYLLAAQEWPQLVALNIGYAKTNQAAAWAIAQLATLGVALALLLISRPRDWGIRFFTLLPLGMAHLAHLLGITPNGEFVIDSALPYWVRLAYLISLPLLAVLAYRHNLAQLLSEQLGTRPIVDQFSDLLGWSSAVIFTPKLEDTLRGSVQFAANLMGANFVAVGIMGDGDNLNVMSLRPSETGGNPMIYRWILKISDWPGMQLSLRQRAAVELLPNGIGARQLFGLYQELGISAAGAMLIEPVFGSRGQQVGLLLLGGAPHLDHWSEDDKVLTPHVAAFIGQAVENAQIYETIA
ncbi:MAG: GAF domain-containing protein, partial [Anaerolineales bacterium]|nr:GAF domain-containing protein [Anaerolineales bacterium]